MIFLGVILVVAGFTLVLMFALVGVQWFSERDNWPDWLAFSLAVGWVLFCGGMTAAGLYEVMHH